MAAAASDAESLEALLEENRALHADHEALLAETEQCGLALGLEEWTPATSTGGLISRSRVESLERERNMLLGVSRIGSELEELRDVNDKLTGEANQLRAENDKLMSENAALRDRTQNVTPPTSSVRQASPSSVRQASPPRALAESGVCLDAQLLPPEMAKRADDISAAIKLGRLDVLNTCSEEQRKELVAAMLKVGLTTTSPRYEVEAVLAPAVPLMPPAARKLPPSQPQAASKSQPPQHPTPPLAVEPEGLRKHISVVVTPTVASAREKIGTSEPVPDAAPVNVQVSASAASGLARESAEPRKQALPTAAPAVARTQSSSTAAPAVARTQASSTAAPAVARTNPSARVSPPVSSSGSALERRAQNIAEALRKGDSKALSSCSDEERKDLVAEMLRQGVFMTQTSTPAPIPSSSSISNVVVEDVEPTAMQENSLRGALEKLNNKPGADSPSKTPGFLSEVQIPDGIDDDNFRERFIREKLQEMTTQQNG